MLGLIFPSDLSPSLPPSPPRLEVPYVMGWVSGEHASFLALGFFKEEDPSLVPGKRQKRNKIAVFRMRRNKVREEDENDKEDEEDEARRSPRVRRKQHAYSKTRPRKQKEISGVLESNLSTTASNPKSSPWSMMKFRQFLCMCCRTQQKLVEENKASGSKERRNPNEKENGGADSVNE